VPPACFLNSRCTLLAATARAEVSEVKIAPSYGIAYLPLVVMEQNRLLEKHAKAAGLGDIKVSWVTISGGAGMNDALLSGNVDFVSGGIPPFSLLWEKPRAVCGGIAALSAMPIFLNTRNPAVKSIATWARRTASRCPPSNRRRRRFSCRWRRSRRSVRATSRARRAKPYRCRTRRLRRCCSPARVKSTTTSLRRRFSIASSSSRASARS
jgi:hypothetical protein